MSVRLREAEAQAELRENRQRLLEMETQVRAEQLLLHLFMHAYFKFKVNLKKKVQMVFSESFNNYFFSDRFKKVKSKSLLNFFILDSKNICFSTRPTL